MFFKSIRFSLTLRYCLTLAIILALFSCFLYVTIRKQFYREVDRDLLTVAEALASPTLEPFRNSPSSVFDQVLEDFIGPKANGKYVQLFDNTGMATASSKNLVGIPFPLNNAVLREASLGKIVYRTDRLGSLPVRTIIYPVLTDGSLSRIVQICSSLEKISDVLQHILVIMCISIPLAICLFGYGGWFLAGLALKPVGMLTRSARRISAENWGTACRLSILRMS